MSSHHWFELKIPPVIVFIAALFAVWLSDKMFPMSGLLSGMNVYIALVFIILGLFSGVAGLVSFKLAKTTVNPLKLDKASALVDSGMYRFSRNPMYLGMLFIILGLIVRLEQPYSLVWAVLFIAFMTKFQILPEERALSLIFGESYSHYKRRVRRWL
ncbi:isoprenylcysteine carboxylmethyltransferase family protein [Glaciecola sp. SC05]|uniref:methyltransferase family protein n=1 Tax=Glaciecola sp. SC05 TaxID=1987355 RepID=UPI003526E20E